jgi:hypothetical protein
MYPLTGAAPTALDMLGGMSRSTAYEEMAAGRLNPVKLGKRVFITHEEIQRFVNSLDGGRVSTE